MRERKCESIISFTLSLKPKFSHEELHITSSSSNYLPREWFLFLFLRVSDRNKQKIIWESIHCDIDIYCINVRILIS